MECLVAGDLLLYWALRKLSESEEHRLSPNRAERVFHSPRHSPMPPVSQWVSVVWVNCSGCVSMQERTVSEQVLAEAEKRAEIATRVLQEVQLERYVTI